MALIKSKKSFLTLFALVCAFGLFAGVTFVQSQEAVTAPADAKTTSAMPSSCAQIHKAALESGEVTAVDAKACTGMTPEQCKEIMAQKGIKCDAKDMQACMEKMKAAGLCKGAHGQCTGATMIKANVETKAGATTKADMKVVGKDMEACLKGAKAGAADCKDMDKASCTAAKTTATTVKAGCCAEGKVIKADVETTTGEKAKAHTKTIKQCDILTGKCTTKTVSADN